MGKNDKSAAIKKPVLPSQRLKQSGKESTKTSVTNSIAGNRSKSTIKKGGKPQK
jgi:hypothetical protein